ncbi:MAG: Nitrilase/cyanide hydratase and apolipoprotein N-acyltransferase [Bacteroidetes bacterium]|nr:MAG: Nitrilase/cyanide hydratase and apolipoprotein N-acyltransferase [Bacteroidota bacterium]
MSLKTDLRITLVQTSLVWENRDANLAMLSKKLDGIAEQTDLIVLPEMFTTGFSMKPENLAEPANGPALEWMRKTAAQKKCTITGSVIAKENGNYFNRLYWVNASGEVQQYDKRHLFRMAGEHNHYTGGTKNITVELKGWRIRPQICYDLRFPVWSRNAWTKNLEAEYDVLIYVANWPERRSHPWKSLLVARAIENQAYVIGVNRVGNDGNAISHSGDSAAIDFKGELLANMIPGKEEITTCSLSYAALEDFRKIFPVGMDADEFKIM